MCAALIHTGRDIDPCETAPWDRNQRAARCETLPTHVVIAGVQHKVSADQTGRGELTATQTERDDNHKGEQKWIISNVRHQSNQ